MAIPDLHYGLWAPRRLWRRKIISFSPPPVAPVSRTFQIDPIFVEETPRLEYDAPVRNDTGRAVRFTGARWSCTCTAAKVAKSELAPGEETTLHFDIDLAHRWGPQRFVCILTEEAGKDWSFILETTLYRRAAFAGVAQTHFGMVDPNADEMRESQFLLHARTVEELPTEVSFEAESDRVRIEPGAATVEELPTGVVARTIPLRYYLRAPATPGLSQTRVHARFSWKGETAVFAQPALRPKDGCNHVR